MIYGCKIPKNICVGTYMPALALYDFKKEFCGTANFDFNDPMLCILFFNILITI